MMGSTRTLRDTSGTTTPIFDRLVTEMFPSPEHWRRVAKPEPPTKRQKHRAGRLTGQVWNALSKGQDPANIDTRKALTEDTHELPKVEGKK